MIDFGIARELWRQSQYYRASMPAPWVALFFEIALVCSALVLACIGKIGLAPAFLRLAFVVRWLHFTATLILLISPAYGRLTPRVRSTGVSMVLICGFVLASIVGAAGGSFFHNVALGLLVAHVYFLGLFSSQTGAPWSILLLVVSMGSGISPLRDLLGPVVAGQVPVCMVLLALGWWLCKLTVFSLSGERADAIYHRLQEGQTRLREGTKLSATKAPGLYALSLRRASTRQGTQTQKLMLAFGPGMHWGSNLLLMACLLFFLCGIGVFSNGLVQHGEGLFVICSFLASGLAQLILVGQYVASVGATANEQAVICLAPGMPRRNSLNHVLARALLTRAMLGAVLAATATSLLCKLLSPEISALAVLASCAWSVVLVPFVLRNYAQNYAPAQQGMLGLGLLGAGLCALVAHFMHWLVGPFLIVAITTGLIQHRWHMMLWGPVALPARRLERK